MSELFADAPVEAFGEGILVLRRFCMGRGIEEALGGIFAKSPLRTMRVPSGKAMSVSTSSAGRFGWISDSKGYRYSKIDPISGKPWPEMPADWLRAAGEAAELAGFSQYEPDACLINRYTAKAGMGLHQDRNERTLTAPVVSFSFGATAIFFYTEGEMRSGPTTRILLRDGDALVFGGRRRLMFHGVKPLRLDGNFSERMNLTFRRVED